MYLIVDRMFFAPTVSWFYSLGPDAGLCSVNLKVFVLCGKLFAFNCP